MSFADPFDFLVYRDDDLDEEWEEEKRRFNPADWVNGKIDKGLLSRDDLNTYTSWFVEKILDNDGRFPPEVDEKQRAWPPDCPLAKEELRSEIAEMLQKVKAIHERMEELKERLPEPSESSELEPPGIYYELVACLHSSAESLEEAEDRLERALAETPETLRAEWLEWEIRASKRSVESDGQIDGFARS